MDIHNVPPFPIFNPLTHSLVVHTTYMMQAKHSLPVGSFPDRPGQNIEYTHTATAELKSDQNLTIASVSSQLAVGAKKAHFSPLHQPIYVHTYVCTIPKSDRSNLFSVGIGIHLLPFLWLNGEVARSSAAKF